MDWKGIAGFLIEAWGRSALARFFTVLVTIGAGLLGIGWPDVVAAAIDTAFHQSPGTTALWAPITGISLIVFGITARLTLHVLAARRKERQLATALIGQLRELVRGFEKTGEARDAGYYAVKIEECINTAKDYHKVAPKQIASTRELAGLISPAWDASKERPFTNLTLAELSAFADRLEKYYGIDQ